MGSSPLLPVSVSSRFVHPRHLPSASTLAEDDLVHYNECVDYNQGYCNDRVSLAHSSLRSKKGGRRTYPS